MATKATVQSNEYLKANNEDFIVLEIAGLTDNGNGTFTLRGVKPVEFHTATLEHMEMNLTDQGVPRQLAQRLVEEAYQVIHQGLLADAIAQRTKRVG